MSIILDPNSQAAEAERRAQQEIAIRQAAVRRDQEAAAARSAAAAESIRLAGESGARMLEPLGARVGAAYNDAATVTGQLAAGMSEEMRARIAAANFSNEQFVRQQTGQAGAPAVDPNALRDVSQYLSGYVPGASLAAQGAAARTRAEMQPAIALASTREGIRQQIAKGSDEQREYAEELLKIADEFPELRDQAMERLQALANDTAKLGLDERQVRVSERAQTLYEKQYGLKEKQFKHDVWVDGQKFKLEFADQRAAVAKAVREGQQPSAALSKEYGYIVDKNGNAILGADGQKIPAQSTKPKPAKAPAKAKPGESGYSKAVIEARALRGAPVGVSTTQGDLGAPGRYIAKPGAKGVFPGKPGYYPKTTNNARLAQRDGEMSFAEAQSYLMDVYGLKPARARAALIAAGWKPDGRRPASGGAAGGPSRP
jgi:hypothetical protein